MIRGLPLAYTSSQIGFVSTRFATTDGVTLETKKWVQILRELGFEVFFFAGESDEPAERSYVVPEAHFQHSDVLRITQEVFSGSSRLPATSRRIQELKEMLKDHLYRFVHDFGIDLLIVENALAIPLNIPLGLALAEFIAETGVRTISHDHDFYWERSRFLVNGVEDLLQAAFPPRLPGIFHVVINSQAARQLAYRTGLSARVIPNVMDFEHPAPEPDAFARGLRPALGLEPSEFLLLQPTRMVQRKTIEHSIELVRRLGAKASLVISHQGGDEGGSYEDYLRTFSSLMGVRVLFASPRIGSDRGTSPNGEQLYALSDVYQQADLVTYPSTIEGFGNAFLEAIYYGRPIVVNDYSIFATDIAPKGFQVIEFEGFIDDACVQAAREVLANVELARQMGEANYALGKRYYSYTVLRHRLADLLKECYGELSV
jgi:glycosyltransferase involved in cell wall biosynthesis